MPRRPSSPAPVPPLCSSNRRRSPSLIKTNQLTGFGHRRHAKTLLRHFVNNIVHRSRRRYLGNALATRASARSPGTACGQACRRDADRQNLLRESLCAAKPRSPAHRRAQASRSSMQLARSPGRKPLARPSNPSTTSLARPSVEFGLQQKLISASPTRLSMTRSRKISSVSPLAESAITTSPAAKPPMSPWTASPGCRNSAGVPVELRVAAIFCAMMPLLPIPVTTTRPAFSPHFSTSSTARSKSAAIGPSSRAGQASSARLQCEPVGRHRVWSLNGRFRSWQTPDATRASMRPDARNLSEPIESKRHGTESNRRIRHDRPPSG